jgi:hypothetical protein
MEVYAVICAVPPSNSATRWLHDGEGRGKGKRQSASLVLLTPCGHGTVLRLLSPQHLKVLVTEEGILGRVGFGDAVDGWGSRLLRQ